MEAQGQWGHEHWLKTRPQPRPEEGLRKEGGEPPPGVGAWVHHLLVR